VAALIETRIALFADGVRDTQKHLFSLNPRLAFRQEPDRLETATFDLELDADVFVRHGAPPLSAASLRRC
jgi:hypothetical protein